jgi:tetratricopeptide (TPR) repeat protein
VADSLYHLGGALRGARQLPESEAKLREALAIHRKFLGNDSDAVSKDLTDLGITLLDARRFDEAVVCLQEALDIRKKNASDEDDPSVARALAHLGDALLKAGKLAEAEDLMRKALAVQIKVLGPEHREVAVSHRRLGVALLNEDKLTEAEVELRSAFEWRNKQPNWEKERWGLSDPVPYLFSVLKREGKVDELRGLEEAYLNEVKVKSGPDSLSALDAMDRVAWDYYRAGLTAEALPLAEESVKGLRSKGLTNDIETAYAIDTLACIYDALDRFDEAVKLFEEGVERAKAAPSPGGTVGRQTIGVMLDLGTAYMRVGRLSDSQRVFEQALALQQAKSGGSDADKAPIADSLFRLGYTLIREEKFAEAEQHLRQVLAMMYENWPGAWQHYLVQSGLGAALVGQKKYAEAEPLLVQGYEGMKQRENTIPGNRARTLGEVVQRLIQLYTDWGKPDKVAEWAAKLDTTRAGTPASTSNTD